MPSTQHDTSDLTLYHKEYCPYCHRVRDAMTRMGLDIPLKDTGDDRTAHRELVTGGGMSQVPCLRIENPNGKVEWMYESADIVEYLRDRFGKK